MNEHPIRPARSEDAADLAELWIEFGRYYAALDPVQYREPKQDGLVDLRSDPTPRRDRGLAFVAAR
jgi:hypothetical protein